jgi:hypothetical protein
VLGAAALVSALLALSSTAAAAGTSSCTAPTLTQPFTAWGDQSWYTLVPGQTPGNFDSSGWTLSGGARVVVDGQYGGGTVLDLPSKAKAVSPTFCVSSDYPIARAMIRDVVGSEGVFFYVSYEGTPTWNTPKNTGQMHGNQTAWTLSGKLNMQPSSVSGWQLVRLTLIAGGNTSDFRLYNLYVDPYSKG